MTKTLLVPIHLDALCLDQQQQALRAMANYTLLPYVYRGQSHGATQLNLSEQMLAPLFNQEFDLKAGIHLHWSLPDALTNGEHDETGTTFPRVPNRWLILRQGGNTDNKRWIIESDYLYPEKEQGDDSPPPDAINILIESPDLATVDPNDPDTYQYQRYRYMGRNWELAEWDSDTETQEYAEALTAVGTKATIPTFDEVKATFAAFYPNCYSVFGFVDSDFETTTPPSGLQYDVIGYYSDEQQDFLNLFLAKNEGKTNEELLEIFQEEFNWTIELDQIGDEFPTTTVYHARITFTGLGNSLAERVNSLSQPTIAVANSAPEALAAYLAHSFKSESPDTAEPIRREVEDKIQALQLLEKLESHKLNIDARLLEGRHERGFATQHDGYLWTLQPPVAQQRGQRTTQPSQHRLPENVAEALNELNRLQEEYNQAWLNIESMRRQLYSQWYYFMKNKTEDGGHFYDTIYETSLAPLRTAIAMVGELEFTENRKNTTVTAKSLPFGIVSKLNEDFEQYVGAIQAASDQDFSYIKNEFAKCGVTLSDHPTVQTITTDEAWRIEDREQTYDVKVEGGIFNIYIPATESQIAVQITNAIRQLQEAIASPSLEYNLRPFPSENYWRANEPVILLTGDAAKAPVRFGQDGRLRDDGYLKCQPLDFDVTTITQDFEKLLKQIDDFQPENGEESINFITWNEQPWNPFAFHWSVLAYPCRDMESGEVQDYKPNQILDNYSLESNAIDLQLKEGRESSFVENSNSYTGFSILSPAAGTDLRERITDYLTEYLLPDYYEDNEIPESEQTPDYLKNNFQHVKEWYIEKSELADKEPEEQVKDSIFVALWAYEEMGTLQSMAQCIGGFNDTLLLAQPTFQLEVDDPLSLAEVEKMFHEQVRWTLGNSLQYKVLEGDIFNPIRSGAMSINWLWLIDTFGQHKKVIEGSETTEVVTTYRMTPPASLNDNKVLLPPRLAQPARLNFHWLAANALQEVEMTKVPGKTPVCGWVVPNNLDSNLAIYDAQGVSLGTIDRGGKWRNAPGVNLERSGDDYPQLPNRHLQKMVHYLLDQGVEFQQKFISSLNESLETIDPESFAEHPSLALLLGRPMALVRATFNLEVKGIPACDPTVKIEGVDQAPATYGFTEVKFPIRLGDSQQLNDGLVGYWRETPVGDEEDYEYENNIFYAVQSGTVENNLIKTEAEVEGLVCFEQTVDATPQGVSMLIDPRGLIHATSGILPNQVLRLPAENYNSALQAIEVNFLSTPILCNQGEMAIPLSQEPGYTWSWLSKVGEDWSEKETIEPVNLKAKFSKPQQAYEGWLQLSRAENTEDS
ncbi:hypothetical protein [Okeania sp. SIO2B9]|uniref:hypothetical protein n=1 Tax=Okeania sp. SIO2B9 TaxID=2607782 RepID=UPI00142C3F76|nr:hypothetical protein [Okeania sp. SIO2B9]NES88939.1 hypothetical protein [Okeania sp. SIO2B9]